MPSRSAARVTGSLVRRRARLGTVLTIAAAIALFGSACNSTDSSPSGVSAARAEAIASSRSAVASSTQSTKAGPSQAVVPPGTSLVATARGARVSIHSTPDGTVRNKLNNPTAVGAPLTFRILEQRPGWLKVQLPVRPNGSSGWIAANDVSVSSTPYRLVISMSRHRLDVIYEGRRIARHEVGVGKVATPTPKGTYYLTELIQPPDPAGAYGPYAFGLSAFSNTLKTFAGGPGQLGLHGTNAPKGLGSDISHGCIRVANDVITQLAGDLPLGTPVDIK